MQTVPEIFRVQANVLFLTNLKVVKPTSGDSIRAAHPHETLTANVPDNHNAFCTTHSNIFKMVQNLKGSGGLILIPVAL